MSKKRQTHIEIFKSRGQKEHPTKKEEPLLFERITYLHDGNNPMPVLIAFVHLVDWFMST